MDIVSIRDRDSSCSPREDTCSNILLGMIIRKMTLMTGMLMREVKHFAAKCSQTSLENKWAELLLVTIRIRQSLIARNENREQQIFGYFHYLEVQKVLGHSGQGLRSQCFMLHILSDLCFVLLLRKKKSNNLSVNRTFLLIHTTKSSTDESSVWFTQDLQSSTGCFPRRYNQCQGLRLSSLTWKALTTTDKI